MTRSLLAAAVAVTAVGCSTLPPEARQQLRRSLQLYQTGQYDRAIEELDKFLALYGASRPAAEGFYLRAQSYLKLGRIQPARADLKRALKLSNRDDLTARVHAALGSIAYRQHNPTLACWHYQQALPGLPDKPPKDLVLYRLGLCRQRQGQWAKARSLFAQVWYRYPRSPVAAAARRRFSWSRDFFTIQAGAFSRLANAVRQVQRLREAGLDATQELETRSGQPLYVVHVGRYPTYASAQQYLRRVRQLVPEAVIVP